MAYGSLGRTASGRGMSMSAYPPGTFAGAKRFSTRAGAQASAASRQLGGGYGGGYNSANLEAEAKAAVEEAKQKQEASKTSALGYYAPIQQGLAALSPELITPGQQTSMLAERRAKLGAYGQNLSSLYADPYSGVQAGQRQQIGMGIAGRQANLPIELELDVAKQNRESTLGLYGAQADVAGGMAGVQTAYQYDPGLEYIKSLGYGMGYQQQGGSGASTRLGGGGATTSSRAGGGTTGSKATGGIRQRSHSASAWDARSAASSAKIKAQQAARTKSRGY